MASAPSHGNAHSWQCPLICSHVPEATAASACIRLKLGGPRGSQVATHLILRWRVDDCMTGHYERSMITRQLSVAPLDEAMASPTP